MISLLCYIGLALPSRTAPADVQFGDDEGIMRGNVAFQGQRPGCDRHLVGSNDAVFDQDPEPWAEDPAHRDRRNGLIGL